MHLSERSPIKFTSIGLFWQAGVTNEHLGAKAHPSGRSPSNGGLPLIARGMA